MCWTSPADRVTRHTDRSHPKALKNRRRVDTQKKGKTPFFCPRTGPGVPSREVKIQREMQSYAIKANLGVGVGPSRKGESYRGSILDLAYVPYATKSLADYCARATFLLGRLQAAQLRLK